MASKKKVDKRGLDIKQDKMQEYLLRKYGREPKLTKDELEKLRWNWH